MIETLNSDDCAKLLYCTPEQVEELARSGDLPAVKIGRGWLFVKADLLSYLSEKARADAQDRRAKRQPNITVLAKPRRQRPPMLPATSSVPYRSL
jgi:excisionase family DNA binding protein